MKKDARIQVRVSQMEKKSIERYAERNGMSTSDYIIRKCTEKMVCTKNRNDAEKKILIRIVDIQTSLNELKALQGDTGKRDDMAKVIRQLEKEVGCLWQYLKS